ncbi:hypothetical protein Fot_07081 [Forsythia ovata]|uniref:Uncharacterized protein n=1 Tax=Forsythia ovata TaxID=205694 RepID=A0ABD1WUU0_9LAMI
MVCVQAQRKVESQLRASQNMIYAKDKELTEALAKLSRAKDLLANLGVSGYVDPKDQEECYLKEAIAKEEESSSNGNVNSSTSGFPQGLLGLQMDLLLVGRRRVACHQEK